MPWGASLTSTLKSSPRKENRKYAKSGSYSVKHSFLCDPDPELPTLHGEHMQSTALNQFLNRHSLRPETNFENNLKLLQTTPTDVLYPTQHFSPIQCHEYTHNVSHNDT